MRFALISAVNNQSVYTANLRRSSDVLNHPLYPMEGYDSAAKAYNAGIDLTSEEILIFLHQDVFLPPGWVDRVAGVINSLNHTDPDWAVLGVVGVDLEGQIVGRAYSSGLGKIVGQKLEAPVPVQSFDEIVLILRRDSGVRFDEKLLGYHLYGTDLCQTALSAGYHCYAIDAFCMHNSQGIRLLPSAFWNAYNFLAHKWKNCCPMQTPCILISHQWTILASQRLRDFRRHLLRGTTPGKRVDNPIYVYHKLIDMGIIVGAKSDKLT